MVNIIKITDLTAPELAVYTQLTQAQLRSRVAPERALFIAESPKVIGTALDAGCQPVSFLMEREKITGQASALLDRCGDVPGAADVPPGAGRCGQWQDDGRGGCNCLCGKKRCAERAAGADGDFGRAAFSIPGAAV